MSSNPARFRIVGVDGGPVPGAMLAVARSSVPFPEIALVADAGGFVLLRLPAGEFTLRAQAAGGRSGEVSVRSPLAADSTVDVVVR